MKKKLIYTMTFLLGGTFLFSSCKDMLQVDSNRVEYELDPLTLNDSVYSVLGILKSVQGVGDRQVLINELRGDLVTVNEAKAVIDVQELSRSVFNLETNKYLDVKDYYSIINNCNIYLARVDTTLEKNNIKLMLPEYVAVKSVRAWTYLQLAINYNNAPYFTEPILTHSGAEDVLSKPMLTREDIINNVIADILPYELVWKDICNNIVDNILTSEHWLAQDILCSTMSEDWLCKIWCVVVVDSELQICPCADALNSNILRKHQLDVVLLQCGINTCQVDITVVDD